MQKITQPPKFQLGKISFTPSILQACHWQWLKSCLDRHSRGDWGNIDDEAKAQNDHSLVNGHSLLSAYAINPTKLCNGHDENSFWIITDRNRTATTALLPHER